MALTKVTYSMIKNAARNVRDYGAVGDGVADDTAAIQAAFGGAGTTPDNIHVYFPNGTYKITDVIKVYRAGQTLRNVVIEGESSNGVIIRNQGGVGQGKGLVIGEPALTDGLWGAAGAINTIGVEVRNLGHDCVDIGLWFVYCRDVIVDNIAAYNLLCVACGNDGSDDCENVRISNVTRLGEGRNMTPDAWYSIGMYRVTRFIIENYQSKFLPAAAGTGGNHIILASCSYGTVQGCTISQPTAGANGISVELGTQSVTVADNVIENCSSGIITFSPTNQFNLISGNIIRNCTNGLNVQGKNSTFVNNYIIGSTNKDVYCNNVDGTGNTFIGNRATSYEFPASITALQNFISNQGAITRVFIPAVDFKQYNPVAQETINTTTFRITNSSGAINAITQLNVGGRSGQITNITLIFNRLVGSTAVNGSLVRLGYTGGALTIASMSDTSSTLGLTNASLTFAAGETAFTNQFNSLAVIYSPTAASVSELIGVQFDFTEIGSQTFISN